MSVCASKVAHQAPSTIAIIPVDSGPTESSFPAIFPSDVFIPNRNLGLGMADRARYLIRSVHRRLHSPARSAEFRIFRFERNTSSPWQILPLLAQTGPALGLPHWSDIDP